MSAMHYLSCHFSLLLNALLMQIWLLSISKILLPFIKSARRVYRRYRTPSNQQTMMTPMGLQPTMNSMPQIPQQMMDSAHMTFITQEMAEPTIPSSGDSSCLNVDGIYIERELCYFLNYRSHMHRTHYLLRHLWHGIHC